MNDLVVHQLLPLASIFACITDLCLTNPADMTAACATVVTPEKVDAVRSLNRSGPAYNSKQKDQMICASMLASSVSMYSPRVSGRFLLNKKYPKPHTGGAIRKDDKTLVLYE